MKFIRIDDVVLNVEHIVCVVKNIETISVKYENNDDPFGENVKEERGVRVFTTIDSHESNFVFEDETIDSFFQKIGGLNETNR